MANNYSFPNGLSNGVQTNSQNNMGVMNTMNNPLNIQQPMQQISQQPQFFLQSQGNLYMINNPLEVSNVPVGVGLSAAISLSEGLLYLKTMQNGVPMVVGYKLSPLENIPTQANIIEKEKNNSEKKSENNDSIIERVEKIEKFLNSHVNKEGEKLQWQI